MEEGEEEVVEHMKLINKNVLPKLDESNVESHAVTDKFCRYVVRDTLSFHQISKLHECIKSFKTENGPVDYIGSSGSNLVYSVKATCDFQRTLHSSGKKRRREEQWNDTRSEVQEAIQKLRRGAGKTTPEVETEAASSILVRFLDTVRGQANEQAIDSWGVFSKQIDLPESSDRKSSPPVPKVLIAIRMHAGVAVSVSSMKRALGPCWVDGMVTTSDVAASFPGLVLPMGDAAKASAELGNHTFTIITSIPRVR